jgi:hypothetical protein
MMQMQGKAKCMLLDLLLFAPLLPVASADAKGPFLPEQHAVVSPK